MTLAEKAYQALRSDIVSGALPPGQPLRMAPLCARYDMGMSPLREALNRLQAERLVRSEAQKGFAVAPLSLEEFSDTTRTRILIETEALRLSVARGGDDWESALVAAFHALSLQLRRSREAGAELDMLEQRHLAFHQALIAACGSRWLLDFFRKLYAEAERYRIQTLAGGGAETARNVEDEHRAIMEAALARDPARAASLLEDHYRRTEAFIANRFVAG